jgi:hypothetical protein
MEMIAHGGKPRTGGGPSSAVAKEFVAADRKKSDRQRGAHSRSGGTDMAGRKHKRFGRDMY